MATKKTQTRTMNRTGITKRVADDAVRRKDRALKAVRSRAGDKARQAMSEARSARTTAGRAVQTARTAAKKGVTASRKMTDAATEGVRAAVEAATKDGPVRSR